MARLLLLRRFMIGALFLGMGWLSPIFAWQDPWAPAFKSTPVEMTVFSSETIGAFLSLLNTELARKPHHAEYCKGAMVDLNGDQVDDYIFILPWMGCGLNAAGSDAYFIVSGGEKGRTETVVQGYQIELTDVVQVNGKIYFLHSAFFNEFEKSEHNHWVYQAFSFKKDGSLTRSNADFGNFFPAATIFYNNPKFKRVALTPNDIKHIVKATTYPSRKYVPAQRNISSLDNNEHP